MFLIDKKLIKNNINKNSKVEVLEYISTLLVNNKYIDKDKKSELNDKFFKREEQFSTGFNDGIAIPHASVSFINKPIIVILRLSNYVDWDSIDGSLTNLVIGIIVPEKNSDLHLNILSKLSSSFLDKEVINNFKNLDNNSLFNYVNNEILNSDKKDEIENNKKNENIFIVGVTNCPTGVAHTFMAAKAIEDEAKKRGYKVKIEKQGQITKDKLNDNEIAEADYVIFAIGRGVDEAERFSNKKVLNIEVSKPLKNIEGVFDELICEDYNNKNNIKNSQKNVGEETIKNSSSSSKTKKSFSNGPIKHLLSGISYMIPFISMAGIVLGLTTAFGFGMIVNNEGHEVFAPIYGWSKALNSVASTGFILFVPILGGFIANSISGRHALAPAMMVSLFLNDSSGQALFNYETLDFGGFEDSISLGFFGAIAAGYLIGYCIKFTTKYTDKIDSRSFQTILPLLLIPIFWTIIPWLFFAFIGYVPVYYLAYGLQLLIKLLLENNLLWLVGMIMGGMVCFDLGGPINKMAMVIGVMFITGTPGTDAYNPVVNGITAVAVSTPPMLLLFLSHFGKFFGVRFDYDEKISANSAGLMGFFGITEGSIPFAAKDPKLYIPSFVFSGAIAGSLAAIVGVGNNVAMWGGPIIYISGGMGNGFSAVNNSTYMKTDYLYALLYFIPLIVAVVLGSLFFGFLNYVYLKKEKLIANEQIEILRKEYKLKIKELKIDKNNKEKINSLIIERNEKIDKLKKINVEYWKDYKELKKENKKILLDKIKEIKKEISNVKKDYSKTLPKLKDENLEKYKLEKKSKKHKISELKKQKSNLITDFYLDKNIKDSQIYIDFSQRIFSIN